ncbi:hypothetical protein [Parafilimonas sp.]|uniref:hypothetical protein n=1 Tax=Parafilimonas sp. TaxID=1969739 RepID=UPI0039E3431E
MAQYSGFERRIARLLESQPWLRDLIRKSYKRAVYFTALPKQKLQLSPRVQLIDVAALCGITAMDAFYFGYYDKCPWNKDGSLYLGHVLRNNKCYIAVCNIDEAKHEITGETDAWNYQQGAMAQWLNNSTIIYNAYRENILGSVLKDLEKNEALFYPFPVQVVNPVKQEYLSLNYRRLSWLRPDYGYFKECANFKVKQDYDEDGIWKIDYLARQHQLIIKISDLVKEAPAEFAEASHKVNHCYYSPDGKLFVFLHRWIDKSGKYSRLICADADGNNRKTLLDFRMISHYSWINNTELIVWARTPEYGDAYITINALTGKYAKLDDGNLSRYGDGHPTISNDKNYIITDTYPDKSRLRTLLLFNMNTKTPAALGTFFAPWKFDDEKRCDLHPRWNNGSNAVSIDAAHEGIRKNYIIKPGI